MIQPLNEHISVELKAPHEFAWLSDFGQVFCSFDHLISGNLCFGVQNRNEKLFIKYAGAQTLMYAGQARHAVDRLKRSAELYTQLKHPALNPLQGWFEQKHGFGLVFPWFEGYALAPMEVHHQSLLQLPLASRLAMFDRLMDLIVQASRQDVLAAGLALQHILIDFTKQAVLLSSLSEFARLPFSTPYPKLPGSPWFTPPEGYQVGQALDDTCNVYVLGALAFVFFSLPNQRVFTAWQAGRQLYDLATWALQEDREDRIQEAAQFQRQWRATVLQMQGL